MFNELMRIIRYVIESFLHVWPLLLITIPIAVFIKIRGLAKYTKKIFNRNILLSIFLATVVGAVAPFCSCSVVPVVASLLISGVPLAPVMSFWLASPSMDPEIFFLSVASLGWGLATARIIATFLMSLLAGYITHYLLSKGFMKNDYLKEKSNKQSIPLSIRFRNLITKKASYSVGCGCNRTLCCATSEGSFENYKIVTEQKVEAISNSCSSSFKSCNLSNSEKIINFKTIARSTLDSILLVMKFLLIAYILKAIITFYLQESWIIDILGKNYIFSTVKATILGIPLYTTNLSAIGLIGGLLDKGMNSGAALSFLIAGATTTIPAMTAVYGLVKKKIFILYILFAVISALLSGILYNLITMIF